MRAPTDPARFGLAPLGLVCVALALSAALFWPLPLHLRSGIPVSAFGDSHVWAFDQIARMLDGEIPWQKVSDRAGFPRERVAPLLGWAPALLSAGFRPLLGPLGAFNLTMLASPALVALAAWAWIRRATGAGRLAAAVGALAFAFSPPNLANLAAGNIDKAQVWVYPAWLALAWVGLGSWRGLLVLPLVAAVGAAAAFTEPYLGLFLPLVATPLVLGAALRSPARWGALVRAGLLLAATAGSLYPARDYYGDPGDRKTARAFSPAPPPDRTAPPPAFQDPVADPKAFFVARPVSPDPRVPQHLVYVGLPLLLAAGVLGRRAFPGRAAALATVGIGVVVAMGPQLLLDGQWAQRGGRPYLLPMAALEALGYPLSRGGQYYRAAPLVTLGLAVLLAGGLSRATRWWERGIGLFALPLLVLDGVRVSGVWPRPLDAVEGLAACAQIAAGPDSGAVLALPLSADQSQGGRKLLQAALHGRATTALPLHVPPDLASNEAVWLNDLRFSLRQRPDSAVVALRTAGFSFVLHGPLGTESEALLTRGSLEQLLGPPTLVDGDHALWSLGPSLRLRGDERPAGARPGSGQ